MQKNKLLLLLPISLLAILSACSGSDVAETSIGDLPKWVLTPEVEDGIASAECVTYSGNLSVDKQHATALARTSLAQRIETQVNALDKVYQEKVEGKAGAQSSSTFSSVSKQLTKQSLTGSTVLKVDVIQIGKQDNLCVLVGIEQASTKALFEDLLKRSNTKVSASQKDVLYDEFKAQKAEEELDVEMDK